MTRERIPYRRLPGRGMALATFARLYQGPDHVLQTSTTGWIENYKRFYYRDIQAILLRRTPVVHIWTAVYLVLTLLFGLPALGVSGGGRVALLIIAGVFLGALGIHLALGPTCACYVRTAVQVERLPSLSRVRSARKVVERLRPLIQEAQGTLSNEELAARLTGSAVAHAEVAAPPILDGGAP